VEGPKECPRCRKISPLVASTCDCRFRFSGASPGEPATTAAAPLPSPPQSRWAKAWWPRIEDEQSARHAARQGMWVAILQAGITATFATLRWLGFSTDAYADVGLLLILAWGFHRMSRVAATLAIAYYIFSRFVVFAEHPGARINIILIAICLLAYVNGLRGTLFYHRLMGSRVVWARTIAAATASAVLCVSLFLWAGLAGYFDLPDDPTRDLAFGIAIFGTMLLPWLAMPHLFGRFVSLRGIEA
jgi:hypothetical protein